jgi:hypothetical protein
LIKIKGDFIKRMKKEDKKDKSKGRAVEVQRSNIYGTNSRVFKGEPQPLKRLHRMGDKAVKKKAPLNLMRTKTSERNKIGNTQVDEDFNDREMFERVYRPKNEASTVAYKFILNIIQKGLSDVKSSTVIGKIYKIF